jgi:preprotein translocase subunit SecF
MDEQKEVTKETSADGGQQVIKERRSTVTEDEKNKGTRQGKMLVYYVLGLIEILLAFRFAFKLLGANPNSGFVDFIYTITGALLAPFVGIFRSGSTEGIETQSVLEPATLIAMAVYAVLGWGIAKLIDVVSGKKEPV